MKNYINILTTFLITLFVSVGLLQSCTKYGKGFLSPSVSYAVNQFSINKGRIATSYSLTTDGSSVPLHIKWTHIYDATGNIVDTLFTKKYLVPIWTASYNPLLDTSYALIIAKRSTAMLQPIVVNESNGTIEANSGTIFLPSGTYSMDMEVSNAAGKQILKNLISLLIIDGKPVEIAPETDVFSNALLKAGSASFAGAAGGINNGTFFRGPNNPYDNFTVTRFADTPNIFILKIMDRNGVVFNPKLGEISKRLRSGLNPVPPFFQNLQDYAPDTFIATDSALTLKYPLVPFPIESLGNAFNMYYRIPSKFASIDSTSSWSSNTEALYYTGVNDVHYKGVYQNGVFDYSVRIPLRILVTGAYLMTLKILNTTHR